MKSKNGEHPLGDVGQVLLLLLFLIVWVGDSFFLHVSTFLSDHISLYVRLGILIAIFPVAVCLLKGGHVVVRHEERPSIVVVTGAFRYVRHPLYLGSMVSCLALVATTTSLISFGVLMMMVLFYNLIASYEEVVLAEKFGESYDTYKRTTGKWLPRMGVRAKLSELREEEKGL